MRSFSRFAAYFMEVARHGSLRKAAERLHVSASAINRQILQA
ncbi:MULTISPECIES: helix-turn-helix domain-containing protein [unclassified Pantoea]